jgi:hypothetical protein
MPAARLIVVAPVASYIWRRLSRDLMIISEIYSVGRGLVIISEIYACGAPVVLYISRRNGRDCAIAQDIYDVAARHLGRGLMIISEIYMTRRPRPRAVSENICLRPRLRDSPKNIWYR